MEFSIWPATFFLPHADFQDVLFKLKYILK